MKLPELFRKKTTWLVITFLVCLFAFLSFEKAEGDTIFEVAPLLAVGGDIIGDTAAVMLTERFNDKYEIGVGLFLDFSSRKNSNRMFQFTRVVPFKKWELGIGYAFWGGPSAAWNADNTFALQVRYKPTKRLSFGEKHWSTGGTTLLNDGLDAPVVGWTFRRNQEQFSFVTYTP